VLGACFVLSSSPEGGFYITADKTGITDYGEKLSATIAANWEPSRPRVVELKMDMSLAGAFKP
jgi:hypothetical protein